MVAASEEHRHKPVEQSAAAARAGFHTVHNNAWKEKVRYKNVDNYE
jgi:hypothetical protein